MDLHKETAEEVRVAGRTKFSGRTAFVSFKRPYRRFRSPVQSARNRVVMVSQPIPPRDHPTVATTTDRFDLGQHVVEDHGGRCLTIYHADDLSVHRQARRGEHL